MTEAAKSFPIVREAVGSFPDREHFRNAVAALLASLSVYWLLNCIVGDNRLAAAGTLFVLCLGGALGSYGVFGIFIDIAVPALPFLRRFQPAAAFSLFFVFQLLVWRALTSQSKRGIRVWAHLPASL